VPKREGPSGGPGGHAHRHYVSRGIEVTVEEDEEGVSLELDGEPIQVTRIGDEYHSQLANQFIGFATLDELVEELLRNEGRYWIRRPGGQGPEHPHHHHGGGG
jgi:hypothetical protein